MLLLAGVVTIYEFNNISLAIKKIMKENFTSINASHTMLELLDKEDDALIMLLSGNLDEGQKQLETSDTAFLNKLLLTKNSCSIEGEEQIIKNIYNKYNEYRKMWIKPIVGDSKIYNFTWYHHTARKKVDEIKILVRKLLYLNENTSLQTAMFMKSRAKRAIMPGIVAIISAFVFALIFNYFINYYIMSPIIRITQGIKGFIDNKSPYKVNVETDDEIDELNNSVQSLINKK